MTKTIGDVPTERVYPPVGSYPCTCTEAIRQVSSKKKTPYIDIEWMRNDTADGSVFNDSAFITGKALKRLVLISKRVCGLSNDFSIPDNDDEAAETLAEYILDNIVNKKALVTIEELDETFIHEAGPNVGKKETRKKRRVSFNGYEEIKEGQSTPTGQVNSDDLPF